MSQVAAPSSRQRIAGGAWRFRWGVERQADVALANGHPEETLRLLSSIRWPREHQRYVRTRLWREASAALGQPTDEPPAALGEDRLAAFGAYWSDT